MAAGWATSAKPRVVGSGRQRRRDHDAVQPTAGQPPTSADIGFPSPESTAGSHRPVTRHSTSREQADMRQRRGSRPGRATTAPVDGTRTSTPPIRPAVPCAIGSCSACRATLAGWTRCADAGPPPDARPLAHPVDTTPAAVTRRDNTWTLRPCKSGAPSSAPRSMRYFATPRRQTGIRLRRQGIPADQLHEAIQLYGEGWSCQRLAERYGCNATTVWRVLQQAGVRLRPPWERPP